MIIEQAFMALPEFLVGAPYLQYDSEATLVMAYAMFSASGTERS